jgi:hypothetical protein
VAGHLAENTASKIIGMVPALVAGTWKVEIKTQYTGHILEGTTGY